MRLYLSHVKKLAARWPLILLLALCQPLFGYMASLALAPEAPEMRMAVFSEDDGPRLRLFLEKLGSIPGLSLVEAGSAEEAEGLARRQEVLAAVIVDEGFDRRVARGRAAVRFLPSPASNSSRVVREHVAAALVGLRADWRLAEAARGLGASAGSEGSESEPLSVAYEGPPLSLEPTRLLPGYGVPALFALLLALWAALSLPGPHRRGLVLAGGAAALRDLAAGSLALMSVWAALTALFFAATAWVYGAPPQASVLIAFIALGFYCVAFGGALAALGLDMAAAWVFMPWLLMNMTLGGGLWGAPLQAPFLRPLLPVSLVLDACAGRREGTLALLLAGAVFVLAAAWRSFPKNKPGRFRPGAQDD